MDYLVFMVIRQCTFNEYEFNHRYHNNIQIHSMVFWDWMRWVFHMILSVPQSIDIQLSNVRMWTLRIWHCSTLRSCSIWAMRFVNYTPLPSVISPFFCKILLFLCLDNLRNGCYEFESPFPVVTFPSYISHILTLK